MRRLVQQELKEATPAATGPKPRDLQAEVVQMRKTVAVLNRLRECLT